MKQIILLTIIFILPISLFAIGAGFSYFIPIPLESGNFSNPIAPLNLDGELITILKDYLGINIKLSLLNTGGFGVKTEELVFKKYIVGPAITFLSAATVQLSVPINIVKIGAEGGVFAFYMIDQKINYGNLDRELAVHMGWDVLTSALSFKNNWGYGYVAGGSVEVTIMKDVAIEARGTYYNGNSPLNLEGTVSGGDKGGSVKTEDFPLSEAFANFQGINIYIGVIYKADIF